MAKSCAGDVLLFASQDRHCRFLHFPASGLSGARLPSLSYAGAAEAPLREDPRGPWPGFSRLCESGLHNGMNNRELPTVIKADEVEIAISFLRLVAARKTKYGRVDSGILRDADERWSHRTISNGAVIAAALSLGLVIDDYPFPNGTPNALIGVNKADVNKFIRELELNRHVA